ncbi:hypothetical protein HU200_021302 [Digitaria exilis]|uniref:Cupin type-1 domain-containing protein n=1 Tax=Digitaria exilis TaxID=1010633 RepID=A0A835F0C5_9POAL|nr:hypothetical protein HU200_021302 [Digitaria exilis]
MHVLRLIAPVAHGDMALSPPRSRNRDRLHAEDNQSIDLLQLRREDETERKVLRRRSRNRKRSPHPVPSAAKIQGCARRATADDDDRVQPTHSSSPTLRKQLYPDATLPSSQPGTKAPACLLSQLLILASSCSFLPRRRLPHVNLPLLRVSATNRPAMARIHLCIAAACAVVLALAAPALAGDPDMLQDVCVADMASPIKINGFPCKANITADDFFFAGLKNPGNTNNPAGSLVTAANVEKFPGVNTLGVSMARIDYAPGGQNPPHTHPRATEIIFVLEGTLEVGFITTANKLFTKVVTKGDVFVFPRGLVHFQQNRGYGPAAVIAAFNSQLQGTQAIAMTLFGAAPPVPSDILAKAFRIDNGEVDHIKAKFAPK